MSLNWFHLHEFHKTSLDATASCKNSLLMTNISAKNGKDSRLGCPNESENSLLTVEGKNQNSCSQLIQNSLQNFQPSHAHTLYQMIMCSEPLVVCLACLLPIGKLVVVMYPAKLMSIIQRVVITHAVSHTYPQNLPPASLHTHQRQAPPPCAVTTSAPIAIVPYSIPTTQILPISLTI